ncbi:hypothetical protein Tco_0417401 [Tanacetum coccineum]
MILGRCPSARVEVVPGGENKRALYGSSESLILLRCSSVLMSLVDGLWAQHLLDALCGEGSATATDLLKAITSVVNLWSAGRCPPILAEFVAYALLTPLLKLDNEIWPFTVGTIWRRLVFKVAMKDSEEVARVFEIIRPSLGVKLLGGVVSRNTYFISGMAMRRATNAVNLMSLLPQLHNPQSELLLLRSCMGIFKLFIGLRTCQPVHMEEATLFFDKDLYSAKVAFSYAFVASRAQSWVLQDHILRDSDICGMDDDYVSALACLRGMIPSFDFSCFTNKDTAPSKAQQTLASALFSEMVKDMKAHFDMTLMQYVMFVARYAGIFAKKEAPVNFSTVPSDGISTPRPTDVLVFGWVGGKHTCVDLTRVSPIVRLSGKGFTINVISTSRDEVNAGISKVALPSYQLPTFHHLHKLDLCEYNAVEVVFEIMSPINRESAHSTQQPLINWNEFLILQKPVTILIP